MEVDPGLGGRMNQAVFAAGCWAFFTAALFAGDWPMWRYDAARTAASPDDIADNPVLLWSRKLPPVRPAWPMANDERSGFDSSYEPVAMGRLLFIGSPNKGSVTAYDTATGEEKWKFLTEGPVRCAPVCHKGRIYAGSDDGYLYCLRTSFAMLHMPEVAQWSGRTPVVMTPPPARPDMESRVERFQEKGLGDQIGGQERKAR